MAEAVNSCGRIVRVADAANLVRSFGSLGMKIGPRTGPGARTHEQKEWWCMRPVLN